MLTVVPRKMSHPLEGSLKREVDFGVDGGTEGDAEGVGVGAIGSGSTTFEAIINFKFLSG